MQPHHNELINICTTNSQIPAPLHTLQSISPVSCFILPFLQKTHFVPPALQKDELNKLAIYPLTSIRGLKISLKDKQGQ